MKFFLLLFPICLCSLFSLLKAETVVVTISERNPKTIEYYQNGIQYSNLEQALLKKFSAEEIVEITDLKVITEGKYTYEDRGNIRELEINLHPSDFVFLNSLPKLEKLDLSEALVNGRADRDMLTNSYPRNAFDGNRSIKKIIHAKGLTGFDRNTFSNTVLEGVFTIPYTVTTTSGYDMVFAGSTGIEAFEVETGNPNLVSVEGVLYTADKKTLLMYPPSKEETVFAVPDGVETLGISAFGWNQYLEELTLSSSLVNLPTKESQIINGSVKIKAIYVATGNPRYASSNGLLVDLNTGSLMAFPPANTDETMVIDGSIVKIVPNNYFSYAVANLKSIVFTEGVEQINAYAFKIGTGVTSVLEYVELPSTLKKLQREAFVGNKNLLQVICKANTPPELDPVQIFRESNGKDMRLGVPESSVSVYKNSDWNINVNANANAIPESQIVPYHAIEVKNGTCKQSASVEGYLVQVIADEAPSDDVAFVEWISEPVNVNFVNKNGVTTSFTMPDRNVVVMARFAPKQPYTLIDALSPSGTAPVGGTVNIEAEPMKDGKVFRRWEVVKGEGLVISNPNAVSATFTMVEGEVVIRAVYETVYTINIIGGYAVFDAFEGDEVLITASPKSNEVFVHWKTDSEGVYFADSENRITTFIMPASDVNIEAVFEGKSGNDILYNLFGLYPNPATNYVKLVGADKTEYRVYDIQGKILLEGTNNGEAIFIGHLSPGLYVLCANGSNMKFIKGK